MSNNDVVRSSVLARMTAVRMMKHRVLFVLFSVLPFVLSSCSDDNATPSPADAGVDAAYDTGPVTIVCDDVQWRDETGCQDCVERDCPELARRISIDTSTNIVTIDLSDWAHPPVLSADATVSIRQSGGPLMRGEATGVIDGSEIRFDFDAYAPAAQIQIGFVTLRDSCGEQKLQPAARWTPDGTAETPGFCPELPK